MFKEYNDVVTVQELCEMLRIGQNKAYELLSTNQIPTIRMGKKYVILKEYIIKYIKSTSI